uniref:Uncharacterized protein n=1 Tax=Phlebia radiata TaxID=5308 RepID=L8B963_PHLRA|nr:hypothetical protein PRA_mt0060 [Phlebia radiata]CCE89182.1 hypothetical protein PRA_mt0060 [Phlebia radiata]
MSFLLSNIMLLSLPNFISPYLRLISLLIYKHLLPRQLLIFLAPYLKKGRTLG